MKVYALIDNSQQEEELIAIYANKSDAENDSNQMEGSFVSEFELIGDLE